MKMIYCTCNVSVFEMLLQLIEKEGVTDYQTIEQMTAKNAMGLHRLNNPVWPGYNSGVIIQVKTDELARRVMQLIREFNSKTYNDTEKVVACCWGIEDLV